MFKWLGKPANLLDAEYGKSAWLGQNTDEYLFTLKLSGVTDSLDPKPLWVADHAGGASIKESQSNQRSNRLWAALDAHRHIMEKHDEAYDEKIRDPRVFSDVVIWIPKKYWDNADKTGGALLSIMVDQLQSLHRKDFKGQLIHDRDPHYCVMPDANLQDNEVRIQFGLSVFIPSQGDEKIADISLRYEGSGYPISAWLFRENGRRIQRDVGLYKAQHYLQISPKPEQSSLLAPMWFAHNAGVLQVNLAGDPMDSGSASGNVVSNQQLYGDDQYVTALSLENGYAGRLSCYFANAENASEQLSLELMPKDAVIEQVNSAVGETANAAEKMRNMTIMFQAAAPSSSVYKLRIKAIALPRLDTGLASNQFAHWQLSFDCKGGLLSSDSSYAAERLRFMAYVREPGLWYQRPDMTMPERVTIGQELLCESYAFRCRASPLDEVYHAFLELPFSLPYVLPDGHFTLGRDDDSNTADQDSHRVKNITLNLLDQPDTLFSQTGDSFHLSLNYLGLSGRHIELHRKDNTLHVRQISTSAPFYILDKDYQIKKVFKAVSRVASNVVNTQEGRVALGEHLLLGNYLLEFVQQGSL